MAHADDLRQAERAIDRLEGLTPREVGRSMAWMSAQPEATVDRCVPGLREGLGPDWRAILTATGRRLAGRSPRAD